MAHTLRREWQTRTAKIKIKHVTGFSSSSIVNIANEHKEQTSLTNVWCYKFKTREQNTENPVLVLNVTMALFHSNMNYLLVFC